MNHRTHLSELVLLFGIILSFLLALIVYFSQRFRLKNQLLEEKELLLKLFVKHTPAAVAMFDKHSCYVAASDRWITDYGLAGKSILGENHFDVFAKQLKAYPHLQVLFQRAINGEVIVCDEDVFVYDGVTSWVRYELHPWQTKDMGTGGIIMFSEDITSRKKMTLMKDEFVSTVNHELRTPLTSIRGSLGLLKLKVFDQLDAKGKRLLDISYQTCIRLAVLVDDILDMEKISAGKMAYHLEVHNMYHLVKECLDQSQSYADKYDVVFDLQCSLSDVYCRVDKNRFFQALVNLLSNAAKYSPKGGTVVIDLRLTASGDLRIAVSDKGAGIPDDFRKNIFEKFAQADSSDTKEKGGTGLGLSITKAIVETFGGTIDYVSLLGQGSTFYMTFTPVSFWDGYTSEESALMTDFAENPVC